MKELLILKERDRQRERMDDVFKEMQVREQNKKDEVAELLKAQVEELKIEQKEAAARQEAQGKEAAARQDQLRERIDR